MFGECLKITNLHVALKRVFSQTVYIYCYFGERKDKQIQKKNEKRFKHTLK